MKSTLSSVAAIVAALLPSLAGANTIIDEWSQVKDPPAPALKPVTVDGRTTALLMLDFVTPNCGVRPRCMASVPGAKKLLDDARARGMTVVHTITAATKVDDIVKDLAPRDGEPVVTSGVDKFRNTDLEKILRDKGIQHVITIGTAAHGAVLYTASAAVLRGLKVVLPVDGMSASDPYPEQYVAWHLVNAPVIGPSVTLTRFEMIRF